MMCPFASVPLIRALIPFVVSIPHSTVRGAADKLAVVCNLPIEVAFASVIVTTLMVALVPLPVVEAIE